MNEIEAMLAEESQMEAEIIILKARIAELEAQNKQWAKDIMSGYMGHTSDGHEYICKFCDTLIRFETRGYFRGLVNSLKMHTDDCIVLAANQALGLQNIEEKTAALIAEYGITER